MRYVTARFEEKDREEAYRIYVTRSLQLAPQGGRIEDSFCDIINRRVDTRTAEDVVVDIFEGAGLRFKEDDECI